MPRHKKTEADIVVVQGDDTGGHEIGARSSFTLVVPDVVDLVAKQSAKTLVLAAGGIADGHSPETAPTLGANGTAGRHPIMVQY